MTTPEIPYNRKAVDPVEGVIASAYEQVFGLAHAREESNLPPPPPTFE
jgi:hypothetical protein